MSKWQRVMFACECDPHGDGWCQVRDIDPAECDCIGPTEDNVQYQELDGVLYGKRVKTVDATPRWADVLPLYIEAIRSGGRKAQEAAESELKRMADLADRANAA